MSEPRETRPYTAIQLLKSFWQSDQRVIAYILLFSTLIMTIAIVGLEVALNYWYNYFYNALQDYKIRDTIVLLGFFLVLVTINITLAVYRYYLQASLGLRWRRWLTDQLLDRWLSKRSYYYLENFDEKTDNPDQRIQEDAGSLATSSLNLLIGLVNSITTFFAFIYILWSLSGIIHIPLGHLGTLTIPGYLAWISIIYATIGTYITFKIGYPLVSLNYEQQRREADFRFAAIDLREHAENVALYQGERHQKNLLGRLVERFLSNWYLIILRQKLLLWFTAGYNQLGVFVPLVVALPNYFGKVFKLGGLIQTLRAFSSVQDALSFLINSYTQIAEWRAIIRRLTSFINHMDALEQDALKKNQFIHQPNKQNKIVTKNLTICTQNGEKLLENVNEVFEHGKNYLIKGISGIGKSTLVRTISGIWPYGSGEIELPLDKKIMFIPQRSYMPIGTLRSALLFPNGLHDVSDTTLIDLLQECGLPRLENQLHHATVWSEHLSPGELQRIAFARVLMEKPDWVFLDECTSALDIDSEKYLYHLLRSKLPFCSYISVGHRPSLEMYHDYQIDMKQYSVGRIEKSLAAIMGESINPVL